MFCCCWLGLGFFAFRNRVSLCSPDCLGTHSLDQAGLELTYNCMPLSPEYAGLDLAYAKKAGLHPQTIFYRFNFY